MKRNNYDAHMALLDTALTLKKVADVILSDERCILKALEDISKRMERMEDILGCGRFQFQRLGFSEGKER
jgi:hypothetical protein